MMIRTLATAALGLVLSVSSTHAQVDAQYRDFQLGANLASVSTLLGSARTETTIVHQRPVLMQDLEWRRPYTSTGPSAPAPDSVQQIVFSFYDDQLFRLVVDYGREQTEGMTDADMIEAISSVYGAPSKAPAPRSAATPSSVVEDSGARVAFWGDAATSVALYKAAYGSNFRLIVTASRLEALARTAETQARRLDDLDAPKREMARQKKEGDEVRASQEKARLVNKPRFRP
jgi:hypothetical protein